MTVKTTRQKAPKGAKTEQKFLEAAGASLDPDDGSYRPLTQQVDRDLSPMKQDRMQRLAAFLWESNLIADRLIELPLAFILSDGLELKVQDPEAQKALNRFWRDPINKMDLSVEEHVRELSIFGEQCYPVFVNQLTGNVRLGYLDPSLIGDVITDPDNARQPIGVITKKDRKGEVRKFRVIINADESVFGDRARRKRKTFTDGDCFFFRIRGLASGSRGRSDLLPQIDWLDLYDRFMYGELDRNEALRAFMWDVECKGLNEEELIAKSKKLKVPRSGGVRVRNENEVWSALVPDMKSADTTTSARLFRNHVLGGATLPEHWFGGGGDVNRSTAGEMDEPTFKMLSMRQRRIKAMYEEIGKYQLRKWAEAEGKDLDFEEDPNYQVTCVMPAMVSRDTTKYATALQALAVALVTCLNAKLITRRWAVALLTNMAVQLGVEIDAEELIKELEGLDDAALDELDDELRAELAAGSGEAPAQ